MLKVYAGYYEFFICKGELKKPYMLQFEGEEDIIEDFLKDCDDHILIEEGLNFDNNGVFTIKNGLPELIEE